MTVTVISESQYLKEKFGGIHSAFINHIALLRKKGIHVLINSSKKADIIHLHSYGPYALFNLLTSSARTVVATHVIPQTFVGGLRGAEFFMGIIKRYYVFFYNKADLVIALNPKTKKDLEKLGVTSRIEIISNQVNSDLFRQDAVTRKKEREKYKFRKDDIVVVGVGKQIPRKGFDDFLLLAKDHPSLHFFWAGAKDIDILSPQTSQQKELIGNLPQNVRLLGQMKYEAMPRIYNMADIFLFPSHQEIASMVVIEAAACGLPLILRDLPEYKVLYETGYIACKNVKEFSKALTQLTSNRTNYLKSVQASHVLAKKFNQDTIGDKMIACYNSLLN